MYLWDRLLSALGYTRPRKRTFELDEELVQSVQLLAERDRRPPEEVATDLLAFALDHRMLAERNLARWQSLTPREQQVVALVCKNYTNRQIAAHLVISPETVKTHVRNAMYKFDLRSRSQLRQALADWDFSAWQDANL